MRGWSHDVAYYAPAPGAVTIRFGSESPTREGTMPLMDEKVREGAVPEAALVSQLMSALDGGTA